MATGKRLKVKTLTILGECSNNGCRRVAVIAEKVSDFWVTKCEQCRKLPSISLGADSMARITAAMDRSRAA